MHTCQHPDGLCRGQQVHLTLCMLALCLVGLPTNFDQARVTTDVPYMGSMLPGPICPQQLLPHHTAHARKLFCSACPSSWQCACIGREVTSPERVQHLVGGTPDARSGATLGEGVSLGQRISLSTGCLVWLAAAPC